MRITECNPCPFHWLENGGIANPNITVCKTGGYFYLIGIKRNIFIYHILRFFSENDGCAQIASLYWLKQARGDLAAKFISNCLQNFSLAANCIFRFQVQINSATPSPIPTMLRSIVRQHPESISYFSGRETVATGKAAASIV